MMLTIAIVVGYGLLCAFAGFQVCRATHKQRGLESDRPWTDLLPPDPFLEREKERV